MKKKEIEEIISLLERIRLNNLQIIKKFIQGIKKVFTFRLIMCYILFIKYIGRLSL